MNKKDEEYMVIQESLIDYVGPVFIKGNIDWLKNLVEVVVISATEEKEEFVILNEKIPRWVMEVMNKKNEENNILIIKDMDKISLERQEILLDILEHNQISNENLPENLKIVLNAEQKCEINYKIREIVEYYEL